MGIRIAVLEDDKDLSDLYQAWLEDEGYLCKCLAKGKDFKRELVNESYDLLIMDWLVPDIKGIDVLDWIRNTKKLTVPVIFISQLEDEREVVAALTSGADDYIRKPVSQAEFIARVNAVTRRNSTSIVGDMVLNMDPYVINLADRQLFLDGELIEMTQKEFELASFLFHHIEMPLSRGHIFESVWGSNPELNTRTLDTHVSRIRKKLSLNEDNGWVLTSIYQHGYRLDMTQ